MANKWVKIAIHYATTFVVGGLATWAFKWLIYFAMCDFWNSYD